MSRARSIITAAWNAIKVATTTNSTTGTPPAHQAMRERWSR